MLYNSKLTLKATSLGTHAIVVIMVDTVKKIYQHGIICKADNTDIKICRALNYQQALFLRILKLLSSTGLNTKTFMTSGRSC